MSGLENWPPDRVNAEAKRLCVGALFVFTFCTVGDRRIVLWQRERTGRRLLWLNWPMNARLGLTIEKEDFGPGVLIPLDDDTAAQALALAALDPAALGELLTGVVCTYAATNQQKET